MKFLLASSLILPTITQARDLCPRPSDQVSLCDAEERSSLYPQAAICQEVETYFLVLDNGPRHTPAVAKVRRQEGGGQTEFSAVAEELIGLKLRFTPMDESGRARARLSYGGEERASYTCTPLTP